jgi:2-C-methyl-D-erythritol 4-phosphate cytidylyltransferase
VDGVIVTAAGSSQRFGGDTPKVFATLLGVPVLVRALAPFRAVLPDAALVVTARAEDVDRVRTLAPGVPVVAGGATRQASVLRGLRALPPGVRHVLVHDAARPLVSEALIARVIDAVRAHGAAAAGLAPSDTLHVRAAGPAPELVRALDRAGLFAAQTPQGARADWLRDALEDAEREGRAGTDEAALLLAAGRRVAAVEGDPDNLKLTRAADLALAETLLQSRERARSSRT